MISTGVFAKLDISIKQFKNHQEIHFAGESQNPFKDLPYVKSKFKHLKKNKETLLYVTKSDGGFVMVFRNIEKRIRNACPEKSCKLTTYVEKQCGSACVELIQAGDERYMAYQGRLGFHRLWMITPAFTLETRKRATNKYVNAGADRSWLEENQDIFDNPGFGDMFNSGNWVDWRGARDGNFLTGWSHPSFLDDFRRLKH